MSDAIEVCRICSGSTVRVGAKVGLIRPDSFEYRQCPACGYAFVSNPWLDYAAVYTEEYYRGEGADPLVDYTFELDHPADTIRRYEWRGILKAVGSLVPVTARTRWLDFGCGNGGLVRYCREQAGCDIVGFDEGWIRDRAAARGIPYLTETEVDAAAGTFDVVTAVEVIEHVTDPLSFLRRVRTLLKPEGLFFLTTGNAEVFRDRLLQWSYTLPEIHVSYFEPRTLDLAMAAAGFRPERRGYIPGFTDIIRFKVLKNLRVTRRNLLERSLPWGAIARLAESRRRVSAHPIGWAA